jgi:hypothetical protein
VRKFKNICFYFNRYEPGFFRIRQLVQAFT